MQTVGLPNYLNALPFVFALKKRYQLVFSSPAELVEALQKNRLNVALTSSYLLTNSNFQKVSNYCISAEKQVDSVLLFHKIPICELSNKKVGLTHESKTSAMLLKILAKFHWKIEPNFEQIDDKSIVEELSAFLLIGDKALHANYPGFYSYDLCQGWYELTGLPFVFALFMQKTDTPLPLFLENEKLSLEISEPLLDLAFKKSKIARNVLKSYYQKLNYFFDQRQSHALALFLELAKQC